MEKCERCYVILYKIEGVRTVAGFEETTVYGVYKDKEKAYKEFDKLNADFKDRGYKADLTIVHEYLR